MNYPNLDPDVSVLHCTKDSTMPIELAHRAVQLKQLWIHDDAKEVQDDFDGRFVQFHCPNCSHSFWIDLGD